MTSIHTNRQTGTVAAFVLCSWLGEYVHNLVETPQMGLFSPENSLTFLVSLLLFVGWWILPYKRLIASLLLTWALLHLIGGAVVTVIPFPFLPFYPEQNLRHYLAHIFYGLAQLPLLWAMFRQLRPIQ
jgi:hypothetical protein